jgi:hypothetical protein
MTQAGADEAVPESARAQSYQAPSLTYLGTLRELTQGGGPGPDDGLGGSGDSGSLG